MCKITAVVRPRKSSKCFMRVCHRDVDLHMEVRGFLRLKGRVEEESRESSMYKSLGAGKYRSVEEEQQKDFKIDSIGRTKKVKGRMAMNEPGEVPTGINRPLNKGLDLD